METLFLLSWAYDDDASRARRNVAEMDGVRPTNKTFQAHEC